MRSLRGSARAACCGCMLAMSGCGYGAVDFDASPAREGMATVAVAAAASADDDVLLPGQVTAALVREVEGRTAYRAAPLGEADTLLEVVIRSSSVGTPRRSIRTGLPQQQAVNLVADVTWTDLRSGVTLVALEGVQGAGVQFPTLGEGRPVGRRSAAESLASAVVDNLAESW